MQNPFERCRNNLGFTIIEVLVAMGLLGIVAFIFGDIMYTQQREIRFMNQKGEAFELQTLIREALKSKAVCSWQLAHRVINVVGTTINNPSPTTLTIGTLYMGLNNASGVLAQAGFPVPQTSTGLIVQTVQFTKIFATGIPDVYKGTFVINFAPTSVVRSMRPVEVQKFIVLYPGGPLSAKLIKECDVDITDKIILTGVNPVCPIGKSPTMRRWTTSSCSDTLNGGWVCNLYQGWAGAIPQCESCINWEKCHNCFSSSWNAVECMTNP